MKKVMHNNINLDSKSGCLLVILNSLKNGYQYMHNWILKTENGMDKCHTNIFMHFSMIIFQHMQFSNLGFALLHTTIFKLIYSIDGIKENN